MTPTEGRGSLRWRLALGLLKGLPQGLLSRTSGRLADLPLPRVLREPLLGRFVRWTGIDMSEAERPLADYRSLNELFVRRLRPGVRSWPADPGAVTSPVDGLVGALGSLDGSRSLQAKGRGYTVASLLDDEAEARRFRDGWFVTLYLSPRHYHRIHAPVTGRVRRACHIPGRLLPVNDAAVHSVPELFPRNERLVCYLDTEGGRVAVVAVGAFNVGRISAAFDGEWNRGSGPGRSVTNRSPLRIRERRRYEPPVEVERGEELMAFHLGSTVILLLPRDGFRIDPDLSSVGEVRLGGRVGALVARSE